MAFKYDIKTDKYGTKGVSFAVHNNKNEWIPPSGSCCPLLTMLEGLLLPLK